MSISFKEIKNLEKNKKARDVQGLFVTEGINLFREAPPERIVAVCATAKFTRENPELIGMIPPAAERILDIREEREAPLFLVLENLQDPGNAGTILRTAEAAGVHAVFLTQGAVDLYNPKTIRSTMGAIYRVPHFYVDDMDALLARFAEREVRTFAAHLRGTHAYTELDFRGGTAFFIGNESRGLTDALSDSLDVLMKIPMSGKVESLNAAMAAGILMYEARRQRGE